MDRGGGEIVQHQWNANFFLIGNLPPKKNRKKGGLGSRKPGRDWKKAMRGDGLKLKRTSLTMMKCQKIRNYSFI